MYVFQVTWNFKKRTVGRIFFPFFFFFLFEFLHGNNREQYRIYPAIRRAFCPSRMTSNNLISPMKFCNNTNFTLPKHSQ